MNRLKVFLVAGVSAVAVSVVATGPAQGDSVATSNANSTITYRPAHG